jgi:secreted trypsin-like serine protease
MLKMKEYLIILLCSYLACTWCLQEQLNERKIGSRIIGGQAARAGQFTYSAAITVQTSNSRFFCGGTLLNQEWILTAGQCVDGAELFTIQLGSNTLEGDDPYRVKVSSSEYVVHPDYNSLTLENDVGLIKLRMPVEYSQYLNQIGLLATSYNVSFSSFVATGWGQTSDEDSGLSNDLMWVNVVPLSNEECKLFYGNQIGVNTICVGGYYNEGSCYGDTGSALIQDIGKYKIHIGIASFISGNGCESTDPSGYTRTFPYRDWIRNYTGV